MSDIKCKGCGKVYLFTGRGDYPRGIKSMVVPGIESFAICTYAGGPKAYEYKPECVLLAMQDRCWCCGKEYPTDFAIKYRNEFSFVCDVCRRAANRVAAEEGEKQAVRLYEGAFGISDGGSARLLASLLDPNWERSHSSHGVPVGPPERPHIQGDSAFSLHLFPKQIETLQAFVGALRLRIKEEVDAAGRRGRSLLLQLSQGEISTKEYDARIEREERRK